MMHKGFARIFTAIVFALAVPFFVYAQVRSARELRRLSPASLEVIDGGGKSLVTLDFYGENIFRLFSDPKGGAIRNPESTPPAQILADAPRGTVSPLQTEDRGKYFSVRSKEIEVRISKASGLLSVFDLKRDKKVLEETAPVTFAEGKTTVVFANSEDRGYYGGGVQNGCFAHKGEEAASQPGQGVDKLFDFDKNTIWHTSWSEPAVPFTLTLDLVTLNDLDLLEYYPTKDAGNGTLIRGSVSVSADRQTWLEEAPFSWKKDAEMKTISFPTGTKARWIRLSVSDGVGNFGSGSEVIVYRRDGTKPLLQGDINHDERLDENDLTSYLNYTGLRTKDSDFDYIKEGDINANGLIDAYDISVVATTLDGGASARSRDKAEGRISFTQDRTQFKAGEEIVLTIEAKDLRSANALSFALPYDASLLEYVGMDKVGMKELYDLTNDRLHTDGTKELFPTFVNIGNNFLLEDGTLMTIRFRARKTGSWTAEMRDGLIVDRSLGTSAF